MWHKGIVLRGHILAVNLSLPWTQADLTTISLPRPWPWLTGLRYYWPPPLLVQASPLWLGLLQLLFLTQNNSGLQETWTVSWLKSLDDLIITLLSCITKYLFYWCKDQVKLSFLLRWQDQSEHAQSDPRLGLSAAYSYTNSTLLDFWRLNSIYSSLNVICKALVQIPALMDQIRVQARHTKLNSDLG